MSKITLNIVEPGSSTPVDPGINPAVPNTGLFTHGIGGPEATIITVSIVAVLAVALAAVLYCKHNKTNKTTKLTNAINAVKSKKKVSIPLAVLAMVVSLGTLAALLVNAGKSNTSAAENELTVTESSEDLTIEVGDEPVFAVLPVEVTVEEATVAGYTLTAYTDSTDLVSTTNPDNVIPMVTLPEAVSEGELTTLTDNTYGLAISEPTSKDEAVYTTLSTDSEAPTIIKSMPEYTPTEENGTTTIYYGFYITPDMPYGTYTNDSEVYYNATINTTPVTFDGNGLYFNEDEQQTTNEVEYIAVPEEGKEYTINQTISGEYREPSQDLPYIFLGWSTDSAATVPTYTSEQSIEEFLPILPNTPLTLYAVWQKATTITFDNNGGAGEMDKQTIIAGETNNLNPNTFTRDGYHFTGWNTDAEGTGQSYSDKANYTAPVTSQNLTLYAQWEEDTLYMQDVATWGSGFSMGDEVVAVDSRDGKEYTVAKLEDGKVWMTRNLDLQKEDLLPGVTLDSTNTDHPTEGFVLPDSDWSNVNNAQVYDLNNNGETYHYCTRYLYDDCTTYSDKAIPSEDLGNYYNWYSATAGTGSQNYGDVAGGSICPAGWRLPTGRTSSDVATDYSTLLYAYGILTSATGSATIDSDKIPTMFEPPLSLVRAGVYNNGEIDDRVGARGGFWSSMSLGISYNYARASVFQISGYSGDVNFMLGSRINLGYSMRCVAR